MLPTGKTELAIYSCEGRVAYIKSETLIGQVNVGRARIHIFYHEMNAHELCCQLIAGTLML